MLTASHGAIAHRYGPGPCSVLEPKLARQRTARSSDECAVRNPGCAGFAELIDGDRKPCERVRNAAIAKSADDHPGPGPFRTPWRAPPCQGRALGADSTGARQ